jgi:O-antigen/teichoic acid export membrane protein
MWIGLTILAKPFINIWTGRFDLQTNYFLIFIFGAYGFILSRVHIYSGLITAFNAAKFISIIAWSEAILNLIFTYFLIKYLGLPGAILGTFLASFVCPYLILPRYIYKISKSKIKIPPENLSLILITIIFVVSSLFISLTIKTPLALLLITIIVISFYLKIIIKNLTKEQLNDSLKIFYNLKKNLTNFI